MRKSSLILMILTLTVMSCQDPPVPRPKGYFRVDLPAKEYVTYSSDCAFDLEVPVYSKVEIIASEVQDSCWFNLAFPRHRAKIHCTYLPVHGNLDQFVEDAYTFAFKHEMKANAIARTELTNPEKDIYGLIYDIEGDVASNVQFFVTDSTDHFLRGALYFNVRPNADSLAPVLQYLHQDIEHMMETIQWRDE